MLTKVVSFINIKRDESCQPIRELSQSYSHAILAFHWCSHNAKKSLERHERDIAIDQITAMCNKFEYPRT